MIPHILPRIRMHQHAQRAPPHHQPAHERPELLRREQVHLEHPDRVRPDRPLEQRVHAQLRELAPDALVQLARVLDLRGGGLLEVDVGVEAAARAVGYGGGEVGVGGGFGGCRGVGEGFGVGAGGDFFA